MKGERGRQAGLDPEGGAPRAFPLVRIPEERVHLPKTSAHRILLLTSLCFVSAFSQSLPLLTCLCFTLRKEL